MNGPPRVPAANRRLSPRAALRRPATVMIGDQSFAVETCDVSRDGIGFIAPRPISPGRRCDITFVLPMAGEERSFSATVKVTHSTYLARERFQIGASFIAPPADAAAAIDAFLGTP